ncbi:MAG: alginate export family protein [Bacteroidetes bacterium]|nr:alginate export family protein [Bacteroidota bacterium]
MRIHATTILLLILATFLPAQSPPIKWSGEARFRSEADGRDFRLNTPLNLYTLSRIRLGAETSPSDRITFKVTLQDSRTFGQEASTIANSANIDLFEGYVRIDSLWNSGVSAQLGRMALAYGNERIIGGLGWNNYGRVFDGLLVKSRSEAVRLDLFVMNVSDNNTAPASVNAAGTAYTYDKGITLAGIYATLPFSPALSLDLYAIHERNGNQTKKDTIDHAFSTLGGLIKGTSGGLFYDAEAAFQIGENKRIGVAAYMTALSAGYAMKGSFLSSVGVHADIISGTTPAGKEFNTFTANYATGHKFFGFMDYFVNFPVQTFHRGIADIALRTTLSWSDRVKSQMTFHHFSTMEDLSSVAPLNVTDAGQEADIITTITYSPALQFECGAALFIPNTVMRTAFGGSDLGVWGYVTTHLIF